MATVGTLNVGIRADTRKFDKAMRDSRKRVQQFDAAMKIVKRSVLSFGGAFIGTAAIMSGVRRFSSAMEEAAGRIDLLAKTSAKLGIATEQLAGLQHAANQTGVTSENLNSGLEKMVIRVSEAAQGSGSAADALRDLGLSAKGLNNLSPDEQFKRISTALKGVRNQADRVRITYDLFGRSGTGLANTLELGGAKMAQFASEAKLMGLAIDEIDAKKIEALNDALDRFSKLGKGASNQILIGIAPAASEALNGFTAAWLDFKARTTSDKPASMAEDFMGKVANAATKSAPFLLGSTKYGQTFRQSQALSQFIPNSVTGAAANADLDEQIRQATGDRAGLHFAMRGGDSPERRRAIQEEMFKQRGAEDDKRRARAASQGAIGLAKLGGRGGLAALDRGGNILEKAAGKFDAFVKTHAKQAEDMLKRRADTAATLNAAFASPETVLSEELKRISEAESFGLIGAGVAGRARDAALEQFGGTPTQQQQNRLASLAEVGTIEGFKAMRQRPNDDPQKKTLEIAGKQLTQLEKLNELIERQGTGLVVLGEGVG